MATHTAGRNAVNNAWNVFVSWMQWGSARTLQSVMGHVDVMHQLTRH